MRGHTDRSGPGANRSNWNGVHMNLRLFKHTRLSISIVRDDVPSSNLSDVWLENRRAALEAMADRERSQLTFLSTMQRPM